MLTEEMVTLVVQVNGKLRDKVSVSPQASEEEVVAAALALPQGGRPTGRPPTQAGDRPPAEPREHRDLTAADGALKKVDETPLLGSAALAAEEPLQFRGDLVAGRQVSELGRRQAQLVVLLLLELADHRRVLVAGLDEGLDLVTSFAARPPAARWCRC